MVEASYMAPGSPERAEAYKGVGQDMKAWNTKAKDAGRPTDHIFEATLLQAAKAERVSQGSGAFNLKRTQKLGRQAAVDALDEVAPENRPKE
jgi:hypothetical protein